MSPTLVEVKNLPVAKILATNNFDVELIQDTAAHIYGD
jgi:hypothetical protein